MDSRRTPPKTPFDNLVCSTQLDMLKLILPFMPPASQSHFALYIKFQELQETIRFFKHFPEGLSSHDGRETRDENPDFLSIVRPYLPEENLEMIDNISNMMNMMEMVRQMQAMNQENGEDSSMDFLKNMLSPEQQAMFDAMNQMYDSNDNNDDTSTNTDFHNCDS